MQLDTTLAEFQLGFLASSSLPELAIEMLEAGFDSRFLRRLAGEIGGADDADDLEKLFERAMAEVGVTIPSRDEAALTLARSIARRVLDGQVQPYEGARQIWWRISLFNPLLQSLKPFVGLASEYEDDPAHREEYEQEIIRQCRSLLEGG